MSVAIEAKTMVHSSLKKKDEIVQMKSQRHTFAYNVHKQIRIGEKKNSRNKPLTFFGVG